LRRTVFVDTSCLVALLDVRDRANAEAVRLTEDLDATGAELVTTDAVLIELGNYFAKSPLRVEAIEWIAAIRMATGWETSPLERALVLRGESRYQKHRDKAWSTTDCISMEVMADRGIREVATLDAHFEQAGFTILMHLPAP
jgi:hypothetical protein